MLKLELRQGYGRLQTRSASDVAQESGPTDDEE
jgi:hypothetical protein